MVVFKPLTEAQILGVEAAIQDALVCHEYYDYNSNNMKSKFRKRLRAGMTDY